MCPISFASPLREFERRNGELLECRWWPEASHQHSAFSVHETDLPSHCLQALLQSFVRRCHRRARSDGFMANLPESLALLLGGEANRTCPPDI